MPEQETNQITILPSDAQTVQIGEGQLTYHFDVYDGPLDLLLTLVMVITMSVTALPSYAAGGGTISVKYDPGVSGLESTDFRLYKVGGYDHDADGNVTAVHCEYDESSRGGNPADGRKIKSTIHWVNAADCIDAEIRLYDRLFTTEQPDLADCNYLDFINPESLNIVKGAKLERSLENTAPEDRFQFLRNGYFCADSKDSKPGALVFNKAVSLKDSYKPEA